MLCRYLCGNGHLKVRGQVGVAVGLRNQLCHFSAEHVVDDARALLEVVQPRQQRLYARLGMLCTVTAGMTQTTGPSGPCYNPATLCRTLHSEA